MQRRTAILALGVCLALGLPAARALAGDEDDCRVPMADWQPRAAVVQMAAAQGWNVQRLRIHDGCYVIYASDQTGRSIRVRLNPETLAVVRLEGGDGD